MVKAPLMRRAGMPGVPDADFIDDMLRRFGRIGMRPSLGTEVLAWAPAIELTEVDDEFVVTAELPGIGLEDVNVKLENNVLTLWGTKTGMKEEKDGRCYVSERHYGEFQRSFTLPTSVDAERILATMKDGVLMVRLPKTKAAQGRKIEIRNG
ncbi:MAG: Hsp20/alpha crystallin family protein [Gemmatimonadetes bacterium]|nr:Hsp20/alpha crystallin family protein [Gemmatimonadota bacterium]